MEKKRKFKKKEVKRGKMVTKYQVVCAIFFLLVFLYLCFCIVDVLRSSGPNVKEEKSSSSHSECQLTKRPRIGRTYTKHLIMLTVAIVVNERKETSSAKSSMCLFFCVKTAPR